MNEKIKIILLNILYILFFLIITEIFCFFLQYFKTISVDKFNLNWLFTKIKGEYYYLKNNPDLSYYFDLNNINENYIAKNKINKKGDIVLIGCSFTAGDGLKSKKEAFHWVLHNYTKRTVYNIGISGGGPSDFLYILNKDNLNQIIDDTNNIEYVIYTYISDHKRRIYHACRNYAPKYKINQGVSTGEGTFELLPVNIFRITSTYKQVMKIIWLLDNKYDKDWDIMKQYIFEMDKIIEKKFKYKNKKTKFVVLIYIDEENIENWKVFETKNIKVINLQLLMPEIVYNEKYQIPNNGHPNKEAWLKIVPEISKQLHLNE